MKGILVILDGIGDLPHKLLDGKTPLEAAETPNLDYLASKGELGEMYPINENKVPESDSAIVSILGNNYLESSRGQLEARGAGIKLERGDLAMRANFGTIDNLKSKKVIDRRAGRTLTTKEADILAAAINKQVKLPCKFLFKPTIQHRAILVLKGGFSDNITNIDPEYSKKRSKEKIKFSEPLDDDENSKYTANILNEFVEQSFNILDKHPVNENRRKKGLMPANIIFLRDAGIEKPKLRAMKRWCAITYMPVETGIAKVAEMNVFSFDYPELKNFDVYRNLYEGLEKAISFSIKNLKKHKECDYFYIHFKETDVPGHDNKPIEKKKMVELLDKKFFSFLKKFAEKLKIKVVVTGDHSTPCKLKKHSSDPVPLLLCDWKKKYEKRYTEKDAEKGKLEKLYGKDVIRLLS